MALASSDILVTDRLSIFRTKFNGLLDEFADFTFDAYSGALTFDNNLEITGTLDVTGNVVFDGDLTIDGEAYFDGTYLMLNWGNSSITTGGLRVDRGSAGNDAVLRFDETDDLWKVGLYGGSFTALSLSTHTHDTRYYTETEIDTKFSNYYTSAQVDTLLANYLEIESDITGTHKVFMHNGSVNDDASVELPAITNSGFGWVMVEGIEEYATFVIDGDGLIALTSNSTNVVANADTDANVCIGVDAYGYEPASIKNRLGSAKNIVVVLWYD